MKLFLLTATALIIGMLMACNSTPEAEPEIIFDDGQTYEEVISEPYNPTGSEPEEDHSDHDHE